MKVLLSHIVILLFLSVIGCTAQPVPGLHVGAEQAEKYLPLLKGKRVGLVVNHTFCCPQGSFG